MTASSERAIRFGAIGSKGVVVSRSSLRWLCIDGHTCQPNEVIAYASISVDVLSGFRTSPFADERTMQVGLAARIGGRLRIPRGSASGGHLDTLGGHVWDPNEVFAYIEPLIGQTMVEDENTETARLLMLAGKRMSWAVDVDDGLLPGWNCRARAWWGDGKVGMPTLLCAGICDVSGFVRGARSGFVELFEAANFPAHFVHITEHPIAPCATTLLEQFNRTPAGVEAITADLMQSLAQGAVTPEDWIFAGALAMQFRQSPMSENYAVLTPQGIEKRMPADAVLLSSAAESRSMLRHRKLGYHLNILEHNLRASGPAIQKWISASFEPSVRSLDDIRNDYIKLFDTVGRATGASFLIVNRMSSSGREDVSSYTAFDAPMGQTLTSIAAKEMNLMLDDLDDDDKCSVIDVDAIAAEIGGAEHLPDGVHQSGLMQSLLRDSILAVLETRANR